MGERVDRGFHIQYLLMIISTWHGSRQPRTSRQIFLIKKGKFRMKIQSRLGTMGRNDDTQSKGVLHWGVISHRNCIFSKVKKAIFLFLHADSLSFFPCMHPLTTYHFWSIPHLQTEYLSEKVIVFYLRDILVTTGDIWNTLGERIRHTQTLLLIICFRFQGHTQK